MRRREHIEQDICVHIKSLTSTIFPLGRPTPNAMSNVRQPLGKESLQ